MHTTVLASPFLLPAALILVACAPPRASSGASPAPATAPAKVATAVAATEQVARLIPLTGTLKASAESAVAANASGRVVRVFVERGSVVSKGGPLVQLDTRVSSLSAAEARANLEGIRSQKAQADADCERNQRLFERHVITAQELEKAQASCKVQRQSLAAAEARQEQAAVTLGDATVRAPFAGVIAERFVNVGEYVGPSTRVADLVQADPVRVELTAGERDASAVHVGQALTFEVKGLAGRRFTATVRHVAPSLRAATRDLVFEAVAPNSEGTLRPGMFATAWLAIGEESAVVIPSSALRKDGDEVRAFVVKEGRIEERLVHVDRAEGDRTIVRAGLAVGERIVTSSAERLADGRAVTE
jgi:membrane fusion protein (multidrug efflux system)